MNTFFEIIIVILLLAIVIIASVLKKAWNSLDVFFDEKAKNYATKQDIEEITRKTEAVHTEFKQIMGEFEADLAFKYSFYKKQYMSLYTHLYRIISFSNAIIFFGMRIDNDNDFANLPIADFKYDSETNIIGGDDQTIETGNNKSSITKILELVNSNAIYASPQLIDICSALHCIKEKRSFSSNERYNALELKLREKLVKVIVDDYKWLRNQLRLSDDHESIYLDLIA